MNNKAIVHKNKIRSTKIVNRCFIHGFWLRRRRGNYYHTSERPKGGSDPADAPFSPISFVLLHTNHRLEPRINDYGRLFCYEDTINGYHAPIGLAIWPPIGVEEGGVYVERCPPYATYYHLFACYHPSVRLTPQDNERTSTDTGGHGDNGSIVARCSFDPYLTAIYYVLKMIRCATYTRRPRSVLIQTGLSIAPGLELLTDVNYSFLE